MQQAPSYDLTAIGNRLASGMKDQGITTEELASRTGLSIDSIRGWMCGRSGMTLDSAIKICNALNWPLDRLARREGSVA